MANVIMESLKQEKTSPSTTANHFESSWLKRFVELLASVNRWKISPNIFVLKRTVASKICALLQADKVRIFLVNESTRESSIQEFEDSPVVLVPAGKGIVGRVAMHGSVVNSNDPSNHEWFDRGYDYPSVKTGDNPALLCAPVKEPLTGQVLAILHVLGKRQNPESSSASNRSDSSDRDALHFSPEDECMLQLIGFQLAAVLTFHSASGPHLPAPHPTTSGPEDSTLLTRVHHLLEPARKGSQQGVLEEGERAARALVSAEHCRVYVADSGARTLRSWVNGAYVELEVTPETTAGWCACSAWPVSVPDVFGDRRFNAGLGPRTGASCAVLCVPIPRSASDEDLRASSAASPEPASRGNAASGVEISGVIECIRLDNPFGAQDEAALAALARLLADALRVARRGAARERLARGCAALAEIRSDLELFPAADIAAREALGCRQARLLLATPDGLELWTASSQASPVSAAHSDRPEAIRRLVGGGIEGYVAATRATFSTHSDARLPNGAKAAGGLWCLAADDCAAGGVEAVTNPKALLCVPVLSPDGRLVGLLQAQGNLKGGVGALFDKEDEDAAAGLARYLACLVDMCAERRRLESEVKLYLQFARSLPELCGELDLHRQLRLMAEAVCAVLGATHCTPYLVDPATGELCTRADGLRRDLRIPPGRGVAGRAAATGLLVRTDNAEEGDHSQRSDSGESEGGGLSIRSILSCPIIGSRGLVIGVLQAFHTAACSFSESHENLLRLYARIVAVAVENRQILARQCGGTLWSLPADRSAAVLCAEMCSEVQELLNSECAVMFLLNAAGDRLVAIASPGAERALECRAGQGIVGAVFLSGNAVMTEHPTSLPTYDPEVDRPTKRDIRSLLCAPVCDSSGSRRGVLLVVNRKRGAYTKEDEVLLKQVSSQFGDVLRVASKYCSFEKLNKAYMQFLEFLNQLAGESDQRKLTQTLAAQLSSIVSCQHCTIFFADRECQQLFTFVCKQQSSTFSSVCDEIRFPMTRDSIVGYVALTGESLLLQVSRKGEFQSDEEELVSYFCKQVAPAAVKSYERNKIRNRMLSLVDQLPILFSGVGPLAAVVECIKRVVCDVLHCERVNIFTVDSVHKELVMDFKKDCEENVSRLETEIAAAQTKMKLSTIDENVELAESLRHLQHDLHNARSMLLKYSKVFLRVPFGSGIVGEAAASGKSSNLCDLQPSELFEFEKIRSGRSKTRSILCYCANNSHGELVGVIEAINRKRFSFQKDDEHFMKILASHVGNLLTRCKAYTALENMTIAYEELCKFAISLFDCDPSQMFELFSKSVEEMLEVRKCSLFLLDTSGTKLWTIGNEGNITIHELDNISTSVLGQTASSRVSVEQILSDDCFEEVGEFLVLNEESKPWVIGYPIICSKTHQVIGVIKSVTQSGRFDEKKSKILSILSKICSKAISKNGRNPPAVLAPWTGHHSREPDMSDSTGSTANTASASVKHQRSAVLRRSRSRSPCASNAPNTA